MATSHPFLRSRYCDVTIRQPMASSYLPKAARCPGAALEVATLEKHTRYPTRGGLAVSACAIELFGLMNSEFSAMLADLSFAASEQRKSLGFSPRSSRSRWLSGISVVLALQAAEQVAVCSTLSS